LAVEAPREGIPSHLHLAVRDEAGAAQPVPAEPQHAVAHRGRRWAPSAAQAAEALSQGCCSPVSVVAVASAARAAAAACASVAAVRAGRLEAPGWAVDSAGSSAAAPAFAAARLDFRRQLER
jgi:hypothetical protein